jgi:hypothetical protein
MTAAPPVHVSRLYIYKGECVCVCVLVGGGGGELTAAPPVLASRLYKMGIYIYLI